MKHVLPLVLLLGVSACSTAPTKPGDAGSAGTAEAEAEDGLPQGWKIPQKIRKSGCKRGPDGLYAANADFDADGEPDTARVLARSSGTGLGVWIWLSSQEQPVLASVSQVKDGRHDMGIKAVQPGAYPTACGKGHWPCGDKEPAELTLERPAVDFFACGSANRFLHWDPAQSRFVTTWMSD